VQLCNEAARRALALREDASAEAATAVVGADVLEAVASCVRAGQPTRVEQSSVTIGTEEWARAVGKSKKEAEQMAAAEAHFRLEGSDAGIRPKR
jgi:hypothetical protein